MGEQMTCAYIGTTIMPPLFGSIGNHLSMALLPGYILAILTLMVVMHERLVGKAGA